MRIRASAEAFRGIPGLITLLRTLSGQGAGGKARLLRQTDLSAVLRYTTDLDQSARLLPQICQSNGLTCQRFAERNFIVQLRSVSLPVHALCRGADISFIIPTGMKPETNHANFYTDLAKLNLKMNICKVALDSDDEVAFLYELPNLNEQVFLKAMDRMEAYLLGGGLELVLAIKRSEKKRGLRGLLGL
jgi:hypothetical protein